MLRLEGALREIQDATASLAELTAASDVEAYRRAFGRCLDHLRGAQWRIRQAVTAAARQEPGRPRVDAAAAWSAAQVELVDTDPLLRWARDAHADAIDDVGTVLDPPDTHRGTPIPAPQREPGALLTLCVAHCSDLYGRALRTWS